MTMGCKRTVGFVLLLLAVHAAGCAEDQAPRTYVQSNVVSKDLFDGEWYYRGCVIRTDYEAGEVTYPGDCTMDYFNMASAGAYTVTRVRWLIDQNYLIAVRSFSYVEGTVPGGETPILGEPVMAFAIQSHFDIRRDYNAVTGEEVNVIVENTTDRHWAEREFMRVDWSQNLITTTDMTMMQIYDMFQLYSREPAPFFVQEGSDPVGYQWPESYRPRFVRTSAAEDQYDGVRRVAEYDPDPSDGVPGEGQIYYMDFVTNEIFTPGMVDDPYTGELVPFCMSPYVDSPICTSSMISVRHAFLKVPPNHQYVPEQWTDGRLNQFGFWRMGRPSYDASDVADPADPQWGMTDFWQYPIGRFNIWQQWTDEDGNPVHPSDRDVRPVYFYTTFEMPLHLQRAAMLVAAEWNHHYMKMVRVLRGDALPSWDDGSDDDDDYIFDPYSGRAYTCVDGPDVFLQCPEDERSYADDGYDCRIAIDSRDQGPNVPTSTPPDPVFDREVRGDDDFEQDRYLAMEGAECVIVGRVNSCIRHPAGRDGPGDSGLPCEERGDLRYSFFSYVNHAATGWAGVAEMRSDPETGEFISGDANVGGPALDAYRTRALTEWDLQTGRLTEEEYMMGEQYREYMANLYGNVDRPAIPQREFPRPDMPGGSSVAGMSLPDMNRAMERAFARVELLKGEAGKARTFSDRIHNLVGTDIERILFDNEEAMAAQGMDELDWNAGTTERRLNMASTFRRPLPEMMADWRHRERRLDLFNVERPAVWVDNTSEHFVKEVIADYGEDIPMPQLTFLLDQTLYRALIIHEFGHVLGLRHNFGGSADPWNYFPRYYDIVDTYPMPEEGGFDEDGDGHLNNVELAAFGEAQEAVKRDRELAGIDLWQNAAIMDYTGNWYEEITGLPSYDIAAMWFGYGDMMEVWEGPRAEAVPGRTPVHYWKYYHGGEACSSDDDCPFAAGGARAGELVGEQVDAGFTQTCAEWPTAYGTTEACSNLRRDLEADGGDRWSARKYKFCSDYETDYMGDCNTFDEGGSYREIVQNMREYWDRNYLRIMFRRYRYTYGSYTWYSLFMRYFPIAHKIYQDMFYKWAANEGNYRTDTGPFGFYDQYLGAADALNFYIQTLANPNVGSYDYRTWQNRYVYVNRFLDATGAELNVPLGVGKYTYSLYQGGLDGINRIERMGSLYDKWYTLDFLFIRNWGMYYTRDEPYYVNFYDLFPNEMNFLVTGLIADEPGYYMPRVLQGGLGGEDTKIIYPNYWRGPCLADPEQPCWDEDESMAALVPLESASFLIQLLGVSYALSEIPTTFDPSFQEQAQVYVLGSAGGVRVPPDARQCDVDQMQDCEYITYTSDRYHREYLAFRVEDEGRGGGPMSLGFAIVQKAGYWQSKLSCLEDCLVEAGGERGGYCTPAEVCSRASICGQERCGFPSAEYSNVLSQLRWDVDSYESFIRYLLEVQGAYGLNTWVSYSGSL